MLPRVQRKLRVDYDSLKAIRPDLIYISITGFGLTGKRADMTCYDLIAEGYSGIMDITGEADSPPQKIGAPAADLLSGMDAVIAAVSALYDRAQTGKGHLIDISLVESMTRFLTPRIVTYLGSGEVPRRTGAKDSVIAIYQSFETADLPITLGLGNDAMWRRFWVAVGDPEFGTDQRFASNADRHRHRPEIVARIAGVLAKQQRSYWLEVFEKAKIPSGPINRVDEVAADEELISRGLFYQMQRDSLKIPQVGLGIGVDGLRPAPRTPPPRLGEHSEEVLRQLCNLDTDAIRRLREKGVIGP
jgi:crotonobetainyl-CoA:carnitine CoA-transferase CaiB-like acyl-CoA transferase